MTEPDHRARRLAVAVNTVTMLVAAVLIAVALYIVAAGQLLAMLSERGIAVAAWLGERLDMQVEIDGIVAGMRGLTPVVQLQGVRLFVRDAAAEPVLDLPSMKLEIAAFRSLYHWRATLDLLHIDGLDVTLTQGEDGALRLKGMPFQVNDPQAAERLRQALRVLYAQTDIVLSGGRIVVEVPALPFESVEDLNLHLHGDGTRHEMAGSMRLKGQGRLPLSFAMRFDGEPLVPADLVADVYLRVPPVSLEGWLPRRDAGELWVDALSGGGEAWLRLERMRISDVRGRLQIDSLAASVGEGAKVEGLLGLGTRFHWRGNADRWTLALGQLSFRRRGEAWPESDAAIAFERTVSGDPRIDVAVSGGSLGMLAGLAEWLPPEQSGRWGGRLVKLAPRARLGKWRFRWDGSAPEAGRWAFSAAFSRLSLDSDGAIPGLSGIAGSVAIEPGEGVAELRSEGGPLVLPSLYDEPLPIDSASLRLHWRRDGAAWRVRSDRFALRNGDARASGLFTLDLPGDGSPNRLSLLGLVEDGRVAATARYLPSGVSEGLRRWLGDGLRAGTLRRGHFLFEGPLRRELASPGRPRTFQMRYLGQDVRLAFLPGWPELIEADPEVWISAGRVVAGATHGRLRESRLAAIGVMVEPREGLSSRLLVESRLDGELADAFTLFHEPLRAQVPSELSLWDGGGRLQARVRVDTPLGAESPAQVTVDAEVSGGTLRSTSHGLAVDDVSGLVRFDTRDGFSARNLRGVSLGSTLIGSARTVPSGARSQTVVDLRGRLRMQAIKGWLDVPALDVLRGEADAQLNLRFGGMPGADAELEVRSDLRGIASAAPAPLAKPAESAIDTRFGWTLGTGSPRLQLTFGKALAADIRLAAGEPVQGAIALGGSRLPAMPEQGLAIEGSTAVLSLPDWASFLALWAGRSASTGQAGGAPEPGIAHTVAVLAGVGGRIHRATIDTSRLDAGRFALDDASLRIAHEPEGLQFRLDSRQVDAALTVPPDFQPADGKPLTLAVDRLQWPEGSGAGNGGNAFPLPPTALPAMDVKLVNLRVGKDDYGHWRASLRPRERGLSLENVSGNWRALDFSGDGEWLMEEEGRTRTVFRGQARAADIARVSEAFGIEPNLSSASATVDLALGWPGSPLDIDVMRIDGGLRLDLREGRFVTASAKSQALRALGVFNIGTWQRRMKLDFTDLYKRGVAFDTLTGELKLVDGVVSTADLVAKGPSAMFEVRGSTRLDSRALDAHVDVTLPVNSNLYVGCLAGLAACAGIVAVEKLWGDRLEKLTTLGYEVGGNWEDPRIRQLDAGVPAGKR